MLIFAFILNVFYIFMPFGTHIICQMFLQVKISCAAKGGRASSVFCFSTLHQFPRVLSGYTWTRETSKCRRRVSEQADRLHFPKQLPGQFLVRGRRKRTTYRHIQACRRRWTWHHRSPPSWTGRSHWSWFWTRPGGWSTASSPAGETEKRGND